jgi:hypothetical protein
MQWQELLLPLLLLLLSQPPAPALLHGGDVLQPGRGARGGCQAAATCMAQTGDDRK